MNRTILVLLCLVVVIECCGNHGGGKKKLKRGMYLLPAKWFLPFEGPLGELEDTKNISQLIEANGMYTCTHVHIAVTFLMESGYPWTQHTAFTHDGYHLGLFRIPNPGKLDHAPRPSSTADAGHQIYISIGKPPVLLQHGLLDSATSFVISSKTASLGYILYDAGYDVFLCNHRGNKYSQKQYVSAYLV